MRKDIGLRRSFFPILLWTMFCSPTWLAAADESNAVAHRANGSAASRASLARIRRQLADEEYQFARVDRASSGTSAWSAPNRAHDLRSSVTSAGLEVVSRTGGEARYRLSLRLSACGRAGALTVTGVAAVSSLGGRAELDRGDVKEWFANSSRGLEHGFTIATPPKGGRGDLELHLAVSGTLAAHAGTNESEVLLQDGTGTTVLLYKDLAVRDAQGASVPARFDLHPGEIVITIDDAGATYPVTVDPVLTLPSWIAEGNQAGALFGDTLACAGDVNRDGFDDVLVGAPFYDAGATDSGKAFLYLGSFTGLGATAAWTADGVQAAAAFGAVASAGDVNHDGYDDIIIGASQYDNGQADEGAAFLWLGGPAGPGNPSGLGPNGTPSNAVWEAESNLANGRFGVSVSSAGDVNGDGYDDVIIGASRYTNGQSEEGRAYAYYGSASGLSTTQNWIVESNQSTARLGSSVVKAGDVNGDGYGDVIVGAPYYNNGQIGEGQAFVYYGSATGLSTTANWTAESNQTSAEVGFSVSTAGDVNGDGYGDVILGALWYDNGQTDEGMVFVYYGSPTGLNANGTRPSGDLTNTDWKAEGNQASAGFGFSVATAGDVDGDGYSDLLVGAYLYDNGHTDEGAAFLFRGSATGLNANGTRPTGNPSNADWTASSGQASSNFGLSVASAGDVNGDGLDDVIVGASAYDNGQTNEGRAYLYVSSAGEDLDYDGVGSVLDCDSTNGQVWAKPAEALNLRIAADKATITWNPPSSLGGTSAATLYDTLRSDLASDFASGTVLCLDPDGLTAVSTDSALPAPGHAFFYLTRAKNSCADGTIGKRSNGTVRAGRSCGAPVVCNDGNACTNDRLVDGVCVHDVIPPVIVEAPESVAVCPSETALFSVRATGQGTLHYQWKLDGANTGTDSPRYTLSVADSSNHIVACVVSDGCSSVTTPNATFTRFSTSVSCGGGLTVPDAPNGASLPPTSGDPTRAPTGVNTGGVSLHSGEYHLTETDMTIRGRGFDFIWSRTYRSRLGRLTTMGQSWDFSYNIGIASSGANRSLFNGNNQIDNYVPSSGGCYTAAGFFRELCVQGDGTYVLAFPQKTTWTFAPLDGSPAQGKITQIRDRNGNAMSFAYDGSGKLTTITDTLGRTITVTYNADGYISAVTDFTGRVVSYTYYVNGDLDGKAGDLRSATSPSVTGTPNGNDFPAGRTTTYTYTTNPSFVQDHNLRKIIDPLGNVIVHNVYTVETVGARTDKVDRQVFPDGVTAYVYIFVTPSAGNNFATTKTIVNDRAGNVREVFFNVQNTQIQAVMLREYTGRAPDHLQPTNDTFNRPVAPLRPTDPTFYETKYAWNADSLLTSVSFPEGNTITHTYDSANADVKLRANETQTVQTPGARGGDQATVTTNYGYTTTFGTEPCACKGCCGEGGGRSFWTSLQTPRGLTYTRTINASTGDVTAAAAPPVTTGVLGGGTQTIQETWTYNGFGQVLSDLDPQGRCSRTSYYTSGPSTGYVQQTARDLDCDGTIGSPGDLVTSYQYDARGNPTTVTDPRGNAETFTYNQLDEPVRKTSKPPFSFQYEFYYNGQSRIVRRDVPNIDDQGRYLPNHHLVTTVTYDVLGRTVRESRESDPGWVTHEWLYDPNGNVTLEKLPEAVNDHQPANVVRRLYDERDLLFKTIRGDGDPSVASTDQSDYDKNGNVVRTSEGIESTPHVTTATYDGYDQATTMTDPEGNVVIYHYDADSNETSVRVDGELIEGQSGSNARLYEAAMIYDEADRRTQTNVAHFNPQTGSPIGDGTSSTITYYNPASQVIRVTDDNGHSTDTSYDLAGRTLTVTDALLNTKTYAYDANSNVTSVTDVDQSGLGNPPVASVTIFNPDSLDRVTSVTDSGGNQNQYGYDSRGNRVRQIDPKGNVVRFSPDSLGRLVRTERDLTSTGDGTGDVVKTIVTTQAWDADSRLTAQTDDNGNMTAYQYDALNRLVSTTYADGKTDTLTYDVHDVVVSETDPNGNVLTETHDNLGRLETLAVARAAGVLGTTSETWKWDGLSQLVSAQNDGTLVTRAYDSLSNLTQESQKIGAGPTRTLTGVFDGLGNRTSATYPSGRSVTRTYDELDRYSSIQASGPKVCSNNPGIPCVTNAECIPGVCVPGASIPVANYVYLGPARIERRTYNNATRADFSYDTTRRMTEVQHAKVAPFTVLGDWTVAWDPSSNKTSRADLRPGGSSSLYSYDSSGRMIQSDDLDGSTAYTLDGVGNRTGISFNGSPQQLYSMDASLPEPGDFQMNQYTAAPANDSPRLHDASGNLTQYGDRAGYGLGPNGCPGLCGFDDDGSGEIDDSCEVCPRTANGVELPYGDDTCSGGRPDPSQASYDYNNQMVQFRLQQGCGTPETYTYDCFGRRLQAGSTQYFWDGWRAVEERNGAGTVTAAYVYGPGTDAVVRQERGGAFYFHNTDDLGNVTSLTDTSGNVVERYDYGAFGAPKFFNAAGAPIQASAIGNPILFNGQHWDVSSRLYYYRTRYMDSRTGRFTSRDSIGIWGDEENLGNGTAYAANNPMSSVDPTGEYKFKQTSAGDCTCTCKDGSNYTETTCKSGPYTCSSWCNDKGGIADFHHGSGLFMDAADDEGWIPQANTTTKGHIGGVSGNGVIATDDGWIPQANTTTKGHIGGVSGNGVIATDDGWIPQANTTMKGHVGGAGGNGVIATDDGWIPQANTTTKGHVGGLSGNGVIATDDGWIPQANTTTKGHVGGSGGNGVCGAANGKGHVTGHGGNGVCGAANGKGHTTSGGGNGVCGAANGKGHISGHGGAGVCGAANGKGHTTSGGGNGVCDFVSVWP